MRKVKKSKLLAFFMALVVCVTAIPISGIVSQAESADLTYYVSASGNDSNNGETVNTAFKTLEKAVNKLSATTGKKTIKIVGEYTVPQLSNGWKTIPDHTDMIIIEGADANAVLQADELYVKGPTTFQNIKLKYTSGNGRYPLFAAGYEVVFGKGVTCVAGNGVAWNLVMGSSGSSAGFTNESLLGTDRTFTISSGDYGDLTMGSHALGTGKAITIPGLTAILSGDASVNNIYIGQYNRYGSNQLIEGAAGKVYFTDDVNFIMNGGSVTGTVQEYLYQKGEFQDGAALQLIFNNGTNAALKDGLEETIPERGGAFYQLQCASAEDGSILEPTETAGTYKVVGDMIAVAKQDGEEVARSDENGIITVPETGTYAIDWEMASVDDDLVYYVKADGNDSSSGLTAETALKTLAKAIEKLSVTTGKKTIKIVGEYTVPVISNWKTIPQHTDMIIIEGVDANAVFQADELYVKGPTTFQNIKLKYTSSNGRYPLFASGYEVVFGEGVTCVAGNGVAWNLVMGSSGGSAGITNDSLLGTDRTFTISSGDYGNLTMGSHALTTGKTVTIPGLTAILSGNASVNNIYIGQYNRYGSNQLIEGAAGKVYFTDDVNFIMNGGTITGTVQEYLDQKGEFQDGAALQLIFNNGTNATLKEGLEETIPERGGAFYQLNCASAEDGSILEPTETAGTYKVVGGTIAVAKKNGIEVARSNTNGILTVPEEGTYTVEWLIGSVDDEHVYYVSENGSDSADGLTAQTSFATIKKAVEVLNAFRGKKTIKIVGTFKIEGSDADIQKNWATIPEHTDMITIEGNDANAVFSTDGLVIKGPTTFENITFENWGSSDTSLVGGGHEIVFGEGVKNAAGSKYKIKSGFNYTHGLTENKIYTTEHRMTFLGGNYPELYLGGTGTPGGAVTVAGVTATFGGNSKIDNVYIGTNGGTGSDANAEVTFTKNVNLVFNTKGAITNIVKTSGANITYADTAALQFVFNNNVGTSYDDKISIGDDAGACYYVYSADTNGRMIEPTMEKGVFRTVGGYAARAVNRENGKIYCSVAGILTIVDAGSYDITYYAEGDSNGDLTFDLCDLVHTKRLIANSEYKSEADMNGDGAITDADVSMIRKQLVTWVLKLTSGKFNQVGGAEDESASLKESIKSVANVEIQGTVYYVSSSASNSTNEGTQDNPFTSIEEVNKKIKSLGNTAATFLFKRGDVFRTSTPLVLKSYKTYSTYGDGEKPQILGSIRNYASSSEWEASGKPNVWVSTEAIGAAYDYGNIKGEIGNLVFNDGESSAVRRLGGTAELINDGDYYYDQDSQKVYLFLTSCNPGRYFESIEVHGALHLAELPYTEGAKTQQLYINNLSFKYAAEHGINIGDDVNRMNITGCEVGWIGGRYVPSTGTRLGNAIQTFRDISNSYVENNHIYQVFDAGITFQGTCYQSDTFRVENYSISSNLIEYCGFAIETWISPEGGTWTTTHKANVENVKINNNIIRFNGCGYQKHRTDNYSMVAFQTMGHDASAITVTNFEFNNNIFDCEASYYFRDLGDKTDLYGRITTKNGNKFYQKMGSIFATVRPADGLGTAVHNQTELAEQLEPFAGTNATITWLDELSY